MTEIEDNAGLPKLSVVVPASDEEEHIGLCLEAVLASRGVSPGVLEVIVAANGCSDATVERALAFTPSFHAHGWQLEVLDITQGSKVAALNLAEAIARAQSRAFLDADVVVDDDLLCHCLSVLDRSDPVYVTGRMRVTRAKSWVSRRYGDLWAQLPFMAPGSAPGAGFFAVNEAGRARWHAFPDIISDDTFARWLFTPCERIEVGAGYSWPLVEGFEALVRVRRRQDDGVEELRRLYPELEVNENKHALSLRDQFLLGATTPINYAVYAAVKIATRFRRSRGPSWARGQR